MTFSIREEIAALDQEQTDWEETSGDDSDYSVREYENHEDFILQFADTAETWIRAALEVLTPEQITTVDEHIPVRLAKIAAQPEPEPEPDDMAGIEVQLWRAEHDNVRVVQIDTTEPGGRLRINLNDAPIWDGDPATDERPGAHFHDPWEDEPEGAQT